MSHTIPCSGFPSHALILKRGFDVFRSIVAQSSAPA